MLSSNNSKRNKDSYREAEKYLLNIPRFSKKNKVEDTALFLEVLGNPDRNKKIIHVAGTNGKGSVCAYLCSILCEGGYKTGMFTSPHLVEMRERFRINKEKAEENIFVEAFRHVMGHLDRMRTRCGDKEYHPTFFELLFLMGMVMFEWEKVDYIVLETGLGGRLDATNAVRDPALTVITEIGLDHMEYLGNTVEEIAAEKAGIMKQGIPVVYCDKRKEASKVIEKRAKILGIETFPVSDGDCANVNLTNKNIDFSLQSRYYDYIRLTLATKALYQVENAAIAARCMEALPEAGITPEQIKKGIADTVWEARMEEIMSGVYLDGAHNEDGIRAFIETAEAIPCEGRRYLLFSAAADKDYETMIRLLEERPLFALTAATKLQNARAAAGEELQRIFGRYSGQSYIIFENVKDAFYFLLDKKKEEDCIYIAGSLYMAGEIKALLRRRTDD